MGRNGALTSSASHSLHYDMKMHTKTQALEEAPGLGRMCCGPDDPPRNVGGCRAKSNARGSHSQRLDPGTGMRPVAENKWYRMKLRSEKSSKVFVPDASEEAM